MPAYTYRCRNCGVKFTKNETFFDKPLKHCPKCNTGIVQRVLQLPAIVFKGSGWYSTDHRSPPNQKQDQAERSLSEKSES